MRTKRKRTKTRRSIYRYECVSCGKQRWAFNFERAKMKTCAKCERENFVNENQPGLFDSGSMQVPPGTHEGETGTYIGTVATPADVSKDGIAKKEYEESNTSTNGGTRTKRTRSTKRTSVRRGRGVH